MNLFENFDNYGRRIMLLRKNSYNVPKDLSFCRNCNFVEPRHQNFECLLFSLNMSVIDLIYLQSLAEYETSLKIAEFIENKVSKINLK